MARPAGLQHDYVVCTDEANHYVRAGEQQPALERLAPLDGVARVGCPQPTVDSSDGGWTLAAGVAALRVVVVDRAAGDEELEFEVEGLDPSVANALRRIMLSELETMAIEHVFIVDNTSIDEALSHRLGLVPIAVDPDQFDSKTAAEQSTEKNSLVYRLRARCRRGPGQGADSLVGSQVLSGQLEWLPGGSELPEETNCKFVQSQESALPSQPALVHSDILLAKMRPGQGLELEAHCCKGVGREHAKWSPVATAWYRLYPEVVLTKAVRGERARELHRQCPQVFLLDKRKGEDRVVVAPLRHQEKLLEKVRRLVSQEEWVESVQLRKRKQHFIYTVEPTGALASREVVVRAVRTLASKCSQLLESLGP